MVSRDFHRFVWGNTLLGGAFLSLATVSVLDHVYGWDFNYHFENGTSLSIDLAWIPFSFLLGVVLLGPILNPTSFDKATKDAK